MKTKRKKALKQEVAVSIIVSLLWLHAQLKKRLLKGIGRIPRPPQSPQEKKDLWFLFSSPLAQRWANEKEKNLSHTSLLPYFVVVVVVCRALHHTLFFLSPFLSLLCSCVEDEWGCTTDGRTDERGCCVLFRSFFIMLPVPRECLLSSSSFVFHGNSFHSQ